jgi:GNAT superfamily N-acetyltransferase
MVGFFTLRPRQRTLWIEGFFIDQSFQRRGLAREAVNHIPALARRMSPNFTTLAIQVHPANAVCDSFYNKLGFFNGGVGKGGAPVYVYRL